MSNESFTEVTSQSWFSRLGNAFKGILFGIVMVIVSFPLLFWNEGRAVKRYKTLEEGGGAVISVMVDRVDPSNQGKLVHISGKAETAAMLMDQEFGVSTNAIKLKRVVEMYQWQEESTSEQKKKLGGGTETVTTYSYTTSWSDSIIDSNSFKKPGGHENPSQMPYQQTEQVSGAVTVGAFNLSPSLINKMRVYTPVLLGIEYTLPQRLQEKASVTSNTIYIGQDPSSPQVGDVRVLFQEVKPMDISLVATQVDNTFEPYRAKAGGTIELLQPGIHDADAMFQQAQKSNTIITWLLRGVGFIIMLGGFRLILAPLAVFADVLPILGSMVGAGTGLVATLVAGVFSFLTIAIAWFFYRPILSTVLIIIACGLSYLLFTRLRKAEAVLPSQASLSSQER